MVGKLPGISAKEHQDLARHSTYRLTERYSHSRGYHLAAAVDGLPIPTGTRPRMLAATGTDGPRAGPRLDQTGEISGDSARQLETKVASSRQRKTPGKQATFAVFQGSERQPAPVRKSYPQGESNPCPLAENQIS